MKGRARARARVWERENGWKSAGMLRGLLPRSSLTTLNFGTKQPSAHHYAPKGQARRVRQMRAQVAPCNALIAHTCESSSPACSGGSGWWQRAAARSSVCLQRAPEGGRGGCPPIVDDLFDSLGAPRLRLQLTHHRPARLANDSARFQGSKVPGSKGPRLSGSLSSHCAGRCSGSRPAPKPPRTWLGPNCPCAILRGSTLGSSCTHPLRACGQEHRRASKQFSLNRAGQHGNASIARLTHRHRPSSRPALSVNSLLL